jgi:succinoglycan biosynthesis protein ExoL
MDNPRILSVLSVLGHPRDSKRIVMLQESGFDVEAVAFEREYHIARLPSCSVRCVGTIDNGHYLKRILKIIVALPKIREAIRRNNLVYASGPDMALAALIASFGVRRPVILEVGDIRRIQIRSGVIGYLARVVDKYVVDCSRLLVATAPGFVDGYYRQWLHTKTASLVLENKLVRSLTEPESFEDSALFQGVPKVDRRLRIGYFGVLRCDWSWKVLETLALTYPSEVEVLVAGYIISPADLRERAKKLDNVSFRGEFSYPDNLSGLYGDVDLVWAAYPGPEDSDPNWRWAQLMCRSNRFYESCYYKKPIITLAGSADAYEVQRYGIGMIICDQSLEMVVNQISRISLEDLSYWQENLKKIPQEVYMYTTEIDELADRITKILGSTNY